MKILIINNQPIFVEGLKTHLKEILSDIEIAEVASGEDFFTALENEKDFSLAILDADDHTFYWRESADIISRKFPDIKTILLANTTNIDDMRYAYNNSISGFIPKSLPINLLRLALSFVLEGGIFYPPTFEDKKKFKLSGYSIHEMPSFFPSPGLSLTARQGEVLVNLCKGLSNKQIAREMNLAEATVKLHVNALLRSLGASNRTHAVITAQKLGLIP